MAGIALVQVGLLVMIVVALVVEAIACRWRMRNRELGGSHGQGPSPHACGLV